MTNRERFKKVLNFEQVDRLPVVEWACWWTQTLDRWHGEGLPDDLDHDGLYNFFGLDMHEQYWLYPLRPTCPPPAGHGVGLIKNREEYLTFKEHLYPDEPFDVELVKKWAKMQEAGETAIWLSFDGFFWYPRRLFGIEPHFYAFYDQPDLMKEMNEDLLAFNLRALDQFCEIAIPDFMTFGEDMSYNHGPMLSESQFEEFMAPYYRRIVPGLKERGIVTFVDTDGDVTIPVKWFESVGVEGVLPLERMAGVDIVEIRKNHPNLRMIGAFDKTVMHLGEERMRQEFERIFPVMQQGGFIPGCDHQTPPGVSMEDYYLYLRLLREYAEKAVS